MAPADRGLPVSEPPCGHSDGLSCDNPPRRPPHLAMKWLNWEGTASLPSGTREARKVRLAPIRPKPPLPESFHLALRPDTHSSLAAEKYAKPCGPRILQTLRSDGTPSLAAGNGSGLATGDRSWPCDQKELPEPSARFEPCGKNCTSDPVGEPVHETPSKRPTSRYQNVERSASCRQDAGHTAPRCRNAEYRGVFRLIGASNPCGTATPIESAGSP